MLLIGPILIKSVLMATYSIANLCQHLVVSKPDQVWSRSAKPTYCHCKAYFVQKHGQIKQVEISLNSESSHEILELSKTSANFNWTK